MRAVANQKINLSTEISLIYWERNDGLQNYSFKFPPSSFDVWPLAAFQPLTLRRIHFRPAQTSFPPPLMKALQIRDRAGSGGFFFCFFFPSSSSDNSQTWPLQNELHLPQGRERRIKTGAERKRVTGVSAFSLHVLFPSRVCVTSPGFLQISNIPSSRRQIHVTGLRVCVADTCWRGWFKLINVLWGRFCFCWIYGHILSGECVIGCSHMMKMLVWAA